MKTLSHIIFSACMIMAVLSFNKSLATTYTASTSGDWSSSATWGGGSVPSTSITSDAVVIPSGVIVKVASNVNVSGTLASLDVEGSLIDSLDTLAVSGLGTLSGAGTIKFGAVNFGSTASLLFTGSLGTDVLTSGLDVNSSASISVRKMLILNAGIFKMQSGTLSLDSNAVIYISGGTFSLASGSLNFPGRYSVYYKGNSYTGGTELSGKGLGDVTIDAGSGNNVKLASALVVNGTLTLKSGTLMLNSNDLTLKGYILSDDSMGGNIHSTSASNIYINTMGTTLGGSLHFASNGSTVGKLMINSANSSDLIAINSDLKVMDTLGLINGRLKMTGANIIEIGSAGAISGSGASSYVVTGKTGYLRMSLAPNNVSAGTPFFVGTISHYAPAYIKLNSGTPDGTVDVNVNDGVYTNGGNGDNIAAYQSAVNATWFIRSSITSNLSMNMTLIWSSDMEVNNFDRTNSYISHYTTSWDKIATSGAASSSTSGYYSSTRTGITSLSPFAVFDNSTNTGIQEISNNPNINVFPNPALDYLNINVTNPDLSNADFVENSWHMEIRDINGKVLINEILVSGSNLIQLGSCPRGTYLLKIYDNNSLSVMKFNKL